VLLRKVMSMRKNKGFTLIELMVVILIVAILAAVLAPMMTGRIRDAKWTEGKTGAGTIATGIRAFIAEHEGTTAEGGTSIEGTWAGTAANMLLIGITQNDLAGKYFEAADYSITVNATGVDALPSYEITVTAPAEVSSTADTWTLDQDGVWTFAPAAAS